MQPHRRQPTRLPCPWDSPGKNTGVGCHFLLQCMKVKSETEVAQLCPTLCDPMDCSLPGSSVHGIFQASVLEWVASAYSAGRTDLFSAPCSWCLLNCKIQGQNRKDSRGDTMAMIPEEEYLFCCCCFSSRLFSRLY